MVQHNRVQDTKHGHLSRSNVVRRENELLFAELLHRVVIQSDKCLLIYTE